LFIGNIYIGTGTRTSRQEGHSQKRDVNVCRCQTSQVGHVHLVVKQLWFHDLTFMKERDCRTLSDIVQTQSTNSKQNKKHDRRCTIP